MFSGVMTRIKSPLTLTSDPAKLPGLEPAASPRRRGPTGLGPGHCDGDPEDLIILVQVSPRTRSPRIIWSPCGPAADSDRRARGRHCPAVSGAASRRQAGGTWRLRVRPGSPI